MILVSEGGKVREVSTDPHDAKIRAARDDFRRDIEACFDWAWQASRRHREVLVPEGRLHREPRPKVRYSKGINEQLEAS